MANLRNIPPIDDLLAQKQVQEFCQVYNREFVLSKLREAVVLTRERLKASPGDFTREMLQEMILEQTQVLLAESASGTMREVINASGVVLHTNLGRAPLGLRALDYLQDMAAQYNNLEMDLASGERGSRYIHVEDLLVQLTGAEAALVVNNNAAAVLLTLMTLGQGQEVVVSRGQLVEIGGAFRIPEVMKLSGAHLVEVGTTNKTYISDYEQAINEETALLFAAHTSNYRIVGFTREVALEELVDLGRRRGIPVVQDLGSGILLDLSAAGLKDEPTVQESVAAGADVVTFSGDKLLGGPQAGIIVGKKEYIERMKKNQLTRALRVDKMTIAALEGTLLEYLLGDPWQGIPVIRMLTLSAQELEQRAQNLSVKLKEQLGSTELIADIYVVPVEDMVGGGAYPVHRLSGFGVAIRFQENCLEAVARQLRLMDPAVIARRQDDAMLISVRTLLEQDDDKLVQALIKAMGSIQ
ncbi:MAG TPA: L-seryl-tRNA(Sec) selenium transferase [Syntrophomonadaceae bacterium]|nr:L-seryl-tRNA(Sec) selenium transferase [Syntrophomonadaceae bacterium]